MGKKKISFQYILHMYNVHVCTCTYMRQEEKIKCYIIICTHPYIYTLPTYSSICMFILSNSCTR